MPDGPWDDLRDSMTLVAKQGIQHNFAYHPGSGQGAPLMALDKLRPFNPKRASEELEKLRKATLDPKDKDKELPALSGFIWGEVTLVQVSGAWILRFTAQKKPMPALVSTFERRLRALNKEINGAIPVDTLKTAELVFTEPTGATPQTGLDVTAHKKRLAGVEGALEKVMRAQASLANAADELVQRVGGLEKLLEPWPSKPGAPEDLWGLVTDLISVSELPGRLGTLADRGADIDQRCEEAEEALRDLGVQEKREAAGRAFTTAMQDAETGLTALEKGVDELDRLLTRERTRVQAAVVEITEARELAEQEEANERQFLQEWKEVREAWEVANEAVDKQIKALQRALRETGEKDLQEIAESGLNAITQGHRTTLAARILDVHNAPRDERSQALVALRETAGAYSSFLDDDSRVEAVDENPFDVQVTMRATLIPALERFLDL